MPPVINITDQELAELKAYTNQADAAAALRFAMTEYLRLARRQQPKGLSGRVAMEADWQAREEKGTTCR